jgi:hypothetical protein
MKFHKDNLSIEYWEKKLTKYKGQDRKDWCKKVIHHIEMNVERPLSVIDRNHDIKMEQLERCIKELRIISNDDNYDRYEDIARMWKVVKDIEDGKWDGREWNELKLITYGNNPDQYPYLKL